MGEGGMDRTEIHDILLWRYIGELLRHKLFYNLILPWDDRKKINTCVMQLSQPTLILRKDAMIKTMSEIRSIKKRCFKRNFWVYKKKKNSN